MLRQVLIFVIAAAIALASVTVGAIISFATSAFAGEEEEQERFVAELTGVEQVPPVNDTSAIGVAGFKLEQDNIVM
ncbi:MAG TPA: CHRD domain-containing protein [Nitrososphaeraceae archaeon]|nr:CHRD domain-containing protein [Nitrososphaeraceae archaeon]